MDFKERFKVIRDYYRRELPAMLAEYEKTGCMDFDPYELDFTGDMTPIENSVWYDIRTTPIQMYPQIPALNYFLDFANPFIKVAIECDGKEWHDPEKDAKRDARLIAEGWTIYRIPGSKCMRIRMTPAEKRQSLRDDGYSPNDAELAVREYAKEWFLNTSQGIVAAIGVRHFAHESRYEDLVAMTLDEHKSTGLARSL